MARIEIERNNLDKLEPISKLASISTISLEPQVLAHDYVACIKFLSPVARKL